MSKERTYFVTFSPSIEDSSELETLLEKLCSKDSTFSYSRRLNFFTLEDSDSKRVFGRGMWIKEKLGKRGIDLDFVFLSPRKKRTLLEKYGVR
jgi:hypothetical protein